MTNILIKHQNMINCSRDDNYIYDRIKRATIVLNWYSIYQYFLIFLILAALYLNLNVNFEGRRTFVS